MTEYLILSAQKAFDVVFILACIFAGVGIVYILIHVGTSAFYNARQSVMDKIRENSKGGKSG